MITTGYPIPVWGYTTNWINGHCRIDDGPCQYQVVFKKPAKVTQVEFPDVMELELATIRKINEPTTAEELWDSLQSCDELCVFYITVRCKSDKHGLLEVGE